MHRGGRHGGFRGRGRGRGGGAGAVPRAGFRAVPIPGRGRGHVEGRRSPRARVDGRRSPLFEGRPPPRSPRLGESAAVSAPSAAPPSAWGTVELPHTDSAPSAGRSQKIQEAMTANLFKGVTLNQPRRLRSALNRGVHVNVTDAQGRTSLMVAAALGHDLVVSILQGYHADPQIRDPQGLTAFDLAKNDVIRKLLLRGGEGAQAEAAPEAAPEAGGSSSKVSPVDPVVSRENARRAISVAIRNGIFGRLSRLLRGGHAPFINDGLDEEGNTALMMAVKKGSLSIISLLLRYGADAAVKNKAGQTALSLAGTEEITKAITFNITQGRQGSSGVNKPQIDNPVGPLLHAAERGHCYVVKDILRGGDIDINACDEDGSTALHYAALRNRGHVICVLLLHGASPVVRDKAEKTPAEVAKSPELRELLEQVSTPEDRTVSEIVDEWQAKQHVRRDEGKKYRLLFRGAKSGQMENIRKAFSAGAQVNHHDWKDGSTALHWAAKRGHVSSVLMLLREYYANPLLKDKEGRTAGEVASTNAIRSAIEEVAATWHGQDWKVVEETPVPTPNMEEEQPAVEEEEEEEEADSEEEEQNDAEEDAVMSWLNEVVGTTKYHAIFLENRLIWDDLLDLADSDLKEMGVDILMDRKRILKGIKARFAAEESAAAAAKKSPHLPDLGGWDVSCILRDFAIEDRILLGSSLSTGSPVALKLHRDSASFEHEREILMKLQADTPSTHVVRLLDARVYSEESCFVLALERGTETLQDVLARHRLDSRLAQVYALGMFRGIREMHRAGFVHGDVKPKNAVFFVSGADVRLAFIDLDGAQKAYQGELDTKVSIAYVAPERLTGATTADPAVDLWSAGVVLYEMLSGKRLGAGMSEDAIKQMMVDSSREEDWPASIGLPLENVQPTSAQRLLSSLLKRDPGRRGTIESALQSSFLEGSQDMNVSVLTEQVTGMAKDVAITRKGVAALMDQE